MARSLRRKAPDISGHPFVCFQISDGDFPLQPGKHSPNSPSKEPPRCTCTQNVERERYGWKDRYKYNRQTDGQIDKIDG